MVDAVAAHVDVTLDRTAGIGRRGASGGCPPFVTVVGRLLEPCGPDAEPGDLRPRFDADTGHAVFEVGVGPSDSDKRCADVATPSRQTATIRP